MKKMRFSEKQNDVTIATPEDGVTDVIILINETVVTEKNEHSESESREEEDVIFTFSGLHIHWSFLSFTNRLSFLSGLFSRGHHYGICIRKRFFKGRFGLFACKGNQKEGAEGVSAFSPVR